MLLGPTHWGRSFKNSKHIIRALRLARYAKRNYNVPLSKGASKTEIDDVNQSHEIHDFASSEMDCTVDPNAS